MNENPPPAVPAPQEKKGIPALGWVGIGCGTLLVIAIVVVSLLVGWCKRTVGDLSEFKRNPEKAAAEMMVRINPDVEMVSQDESKGEMTIRTKDGKEMTLSYKDVAEGRFTMKDAEGNVSEFGASDLSNVPSWVPKVPNMKAATASIRSTEGGRAKGFFHATSTSGAQELEDHFKSAAESLGFTSSSHSSTQVDDVESRILNYESSSRKLNVVITSKPGEDVQVNVGYEE